MDKRCKICTHENLPDIDQALMDGAPFRDLAAQYGVSISSLSRHTKHLRRALAHGADEAEQRHHTQLQDKLDLYEHRLEHIFHKAQESNTLHISLGCVQEALKIFTLRERLRQTASGQLS
jgi:hypothetical protein